ncbi:D-serine ammonia-lyase [bacterium AH-315-K03]|nr:D-serine ammonia-lyase [bacterium AH-315-K03]
MTNINRKSLLDNLSKEKPLLWLNPSLMENRATTKDNPFSLSDIEDAQQRLERFSPLLERLFPELKISSGIIESELIPAPSMLDYLSNDKNRAITGKLWIKADHNLPVAGSIKARGGIYEVLCFAEELALKKGLLKNESSDYTVLITPESRKLFDKYTVSVGSTGNLGLSIGLISAALGFKACVHMSVEAKSWKKKRLRNNGVRVVEHKEDYSKAVLAGRVAAENDPYAYFVDDENSIRLFLGYSVAALRLQKQLQVAGITVDTDHPLFVYLPCGVGGAPGGITYGLKQVFGNCVHCFFAEPTQAPSMLLGMVTDFKDNLSVYSVGLEINTEADGLAVGQASAMVGEIMRPLLSGVFTVTDDQLFCDLYQLKRSEGLKIEPSAAVGFRGPDWICNSEQGLAYLNVKTLNKKVDKINHLVWTTGGCFVPQEEYRKFELRGEGLSASD